MDNLIANDIRLEISQCKTKNEKIELLLRWACWVMRRESLISGMYKQSLDVIFELTEKILTDNAENDTKTSI